MSHELSLALLKVTGYSKLQHARWLGSSHQQKISNDCRNIETPCRPDENGHSAKLIRTTSTDLSVGDVNENSVTVTK